MTTGGRRAAGGRRRRAASSRWTSLRGSRGSPNFSVVSWMIGTTDGSVVGGRAGARRAALRRPETSSPTPTSAIPPAAPRAGGSAALERSARATAAAGGGGAPGGRAPAPGRRPAARSGAPRPAGTTASPIVDLRRGDRLAPRHLDDVGLDAGAGGGAARGDDGVADDHAHERELVAVRTPPVLVVEQIDDRRAVDVRGQRGVQRAELGRAPAPCASIARSSACRAAACLRRRRRAPSPRPARARRSPSAARAGRSATAAAIRVVPTSRLTLSKASPPDRIQRNRRERGRP